MSDIYMLPNGLMKKITKSELAEYLKKNNLKLREPSYQGSSEEEEQVGIKRGI